MYSGQSRLGLRVCKKKVEMKLILCKCMYILNARMGNRAPNLQNCVNRIGNIKYMNIISGGGGGGGGGAGSHWHFIPKLTNWSHYSSVKRYDAARGV